MAVIKIKTIKKNLQAVINYAKNGDKTDNGILVSSINCNPLSVYEQMMLTKKFYHKENNTLGYHIIQSFSGREISPKIANEIGQELAEELWGDKYHVLVCTHINNFNIHNHIILNSVSFIDGKKYHNSNLEIALLKDTSDRLCEKYRLSVVETNKSSKEKSIRNKHIDNYNRSNEKMNTIKNDIDIAIKDSIQYSNFTAILKAKGYEIFDKGQYFTVKSPYFSRKVRIDRAFGEDYSLIGIKERIYYKCKENASTTNFQKKYYRKIYTGPKLNKFLLQTSSIYRLYVHYLYLFGKLPAKVEHKEITSYHIKQKIENNKIFDELNFLSRHNFKNTQDIKKFQELYENKLASLKGTRENLWRKHNKTADALTKTEIKQEIDKLSEEISTISHYIAISERCIVKLEKFRKDYAKKEQEKARYHELAIENNIGKKKQRNSK